MGTLKQKGTWSDTGNELEFFFLLHYLQSFKDPIGQWGKEIATKVEEQSSEFYPLDPHSRRGDLTPTNHSLSSSHVLWHVFVWGQRQMGCGRGRKWERKRGRVKKISVLKYKMLVCLGPDITKVFFFSVLIFHPSYARLNN